MRQRANTLVLAIMMLSLAALCHAADGQAAAENASADALVDESTPLIMDRDAVEPPPAPPVDSKDSHWSNVKALWG